MLEYVGLTKKYGDNVVVDNLNLKIKTGDIIGFLGPNGAGKTTTIKISCGINNPTMGDVKIFGESLKLNRKKYIKNVGAVLEGNRNIYWRLTPVENMEYFARVRGNSDKQLRNKIDEYLELFDLKDKKNFECSKLSRGMQQKVSICCSLINDSKVLFLDEPTLGLDVESVLIMQELLKKLISKDKIIVVTSHDLQFINNICKRVVVMNKGKLIFDNPISSFKSYYNNSIYNISVNNFSDELVNQVSNNIKYIKNLNEELSTIEIELENDNDLLDVLNVFKYYGADISSVNKKEANVEDLFIDIINKNREEDEIA